MLIQFADAQKSAAEQGARLAHISLANTQKLVDLQMKLAETTMADFTEAAKTASSAKDLNDLMNLRSKLAESSIEKAVNFGKAIYEATTKAQAEVNQLMQDSFAKLNNDLTAAVETATKSAPNGTDALLSAVKSTVSATSAAVDNLTKAARQAAEMTESTVKTAATAMADAVKAAPGKRGTAAA
jgi:phasin family protein